MGFEGGDRVSVMDGLWQGIPEMRSKATDGAGPRRG